MPAKKKTPTGPPEPALHLVAGTEDNVINQRNPIPDPALVDVSDLERTINAEFTGDFEAALT